MWIRRYFQSSQCLETNAEAQESDQAEEIVRVGRALQRLELIGFYRDVELDDFMARLLTSSTARSCLPSRADKELDHETLISSSGATPLIYTGLDGQTRPSGEASTPASTAWPGGDADVVIAAVSSAGCIWTAEEALSTITDDDTVVNQEVQQDDDDDDDDVRLPTSSSSPTSSCLPSWADEELDETVFTSSSKPTPLLYTNMGGQMKLSPEAQAQQMAALQRSMREEMAAAEAVQPQGGEDDPEWLWDDVPVAEESASCSSPGPLADWAQLSTATQNRMQEVPTEACLEQQQQFKGIPADLPYPERYLVFQMFRHLGIYADTDPMAAWDKVDQAVEAAAAAATAAAAGAEHEGVSLESLVRAPGDKQEGISMVRRGLEVWVAATAIQHAQRRLISESVFYLGQDPRRKEAMQRAILYS